MFRATRKSITLAAILAAAFWPARAQDAFGYTATSAVPFSYIDVSSSGTAVLASSDDATATLNLPFQFRFYGTLYSSLCVSTNGLIAFGGCPTNDFSNVDLTSQLTPGNLAVIAPFWMDLTFSPPGAGAIVYQTLGATGSRKFVIQWNNVCALNAPGTLNFEVVLAEGTNTVLLQYRSVQSGSAAVSLGAAATVGIRGVDGQANKYRSQWSYKAPVLSNNLAIGFTPPGGGSTAVDVSGSVKVVSSALAYNRLTQVYGGTVTITNTGAVPLARPLNIVLTSLSAGATALNTNGTLAGQGPYYTLPGTTPLGPGQSATVNIQFTNPSNARISYTVKTYSGNF